MFISLSAYCDINNQLMISEPNSCQVDKRNVIFFIFTLTWRIWICQNSRAKSVDSKLWYILHGQNTRRFQDWIWMNILYLNGYIFIFLYIRGQNSETIKLMFLELLLSRNRPCKEVSWFKVDVKTCIKQTTMNELCGCGIKSEWRFMKMIQVWEVGS